MFINVNFTLDINPAEWAARTSGTPVDVDVNDPDVVDRITKEVRAHAENVVRGLFADMGWTAETRV